LNPLIGRGWPFFFVFVVSQGCRSPSFIPLPGTAGARLTEVLQKKDLCDRRPHAHVDFANSECILSDAADPPNCGHLWSTPVSPGHLLRRFFAFDCDWATVVTGARLGGYRFKGNRPPFVTGGVASVEVTAKTPRKGSAQITIENILEVKILDFKRGNEHVETGHSSSTGQGHVGRRLRPRHPRSSVPGVSGFVVERFLATSACGVRPYIPHPQFRRARLTPHAVSRWVVQT
jgi:hypothetical protein